MYDKKAQDKYRKDPANQKKLADQKKNWALKKNYGITLEEYQQMFESQDGNCAVCGKNQSNFKRMLAVDHDHSTGEVRGLLCLSCNSVVGLFENDMLPDIEKIKSYLKTGIA